MSCGNAPSKYCHLRDRGHLPDAHQQQLDPCPPLDDSDFLVFVDSEMAAAIVFGAPVT